MKIFDISNTEDCFALLRAGYEFVRLKHGSTLVLAKYSSEPTALVSIHTGEEVVDVQEHLMEVLSHFLVRPESKRSRISP